MVVKSLSQRTISELRYSSTLERRLMQNLSYENKCYEHVNFNFRVKNFTPIVISENDEKGIPEMAYSHQENLQTLDDERVT